MTVSLTFDLDMLQSWSMIFQSKRSDFANYALSECFSFVYYRGHVIDLTDLTSEHRLELCPIYSYVLAMYGPCSHTDVSVNI